MTRQLKNKIRALLLFAVFSLNTIAGFACSVGVDMGYNHNHHAHQKKYSHQHKHIHKHSNRHYGLSTAKFNSPDKDDCCSNEVAKFALLEKSIAQNNFHLQAPVFLLAFTTTFFSSIINESGLAVNSKFQFVRRSSFLNDTNIQTAIRRFQI
jgi:hypothetical protein